jgi:phosphoglycolate phosphatase
VRPSDYKLLIFDWDGTLADSIHRIVEAMHSASGRSGFELRDDFAVKGIIGLGLPEAIRTLYPDISDAEMIVSRALRRSLHRCRGRTFAVVRRCASSRWRRFVPGLSPGGRHRQESSRAGSGAQGQWLGRTYFDITRAADETASKPHPLMLEQILAALWCAPGAGADGRRFVLRSADGA